MAPPPVRSIASFFGGASPVAAEGGSVKKKLVRRSVAAEEFEGAAFAGEEAQAEAGAQAGAEEEEEEKKRPAAPNGGKAAAVGAKGNDIFGVGDGAMTMASSLLDFDVAEASFDGGTASLPYRALTDTLESIGNESKRLTIILHLTNFFRVVLKSFPESLRDVVYLCVNKVAPDYAGLELGIGDATIITALASTTGKKESAIKAQYDDVGDLGLVALKARTTQKTLGSFFAKPAAASTKKAPLTCSEIFQAFVSIAKEEGGNSKQRRIDAIRKLLVRAQDDEAGWIVRGLQGKLRIGLAENSVLSALGQACCMHELALKQTKKLKVDALMPMLVSATEAVRTVYSELPNYDAIVDCLLRPDRAHRANPSSFAMPGDGGLDHLRRVCRFTPGVPVHPMLSKPTKGVQEILDRFTAETEFQCEYKYDGERVQIHVLLEARGSHKRKVADAAAAPSLKAPKSAASFFAKRSSTEPEAPAVAAAAAPAAAAAAAAPAAAAGTAEAHAAATYERVVKIYSRNSEDMTTRYPDITVLVDQVLAPAPAQPLEGTKDVADAAEVDTSRCESIVIDGEAVAFDRETRTILPFQNLMNRKKKDVKLEDVKVQVCVFAFDILYYNGVPLLKKPLRLRRAILERVCTALPSMFEFSTTLVSRDFDDINNFLNESVGASTEGLIIKTLNDTYEPSKRSLNWLKLKKDYIEGGEGGEGKLGDSVDLVPIAAWHGKGKRTGVYGAFLLACYNPETESYESACKIGTGFSEEALDVHTKALEATSIAWTGTGVPRSYFQVSETLKPDVWFEPTQVWEVRAADLSLSPTHRAAVGVVDSHRGVALRFPRFLRVREDKKPEDSTSCNQLSDLYWGQAAVGGGGGGGEEEEEEEEA